MDDTPLWAAIRAAKEGLSANQGLAAAKVAGVSIRRQDWLALYREVRVALTAGTVETMQPLGRRPYASEAKVMSTASASGYLQQLDVWAKDKDTGEIIIRPYSIATDDLMTRADAVATALENVQRHADLYGEKILGVTYRNTYLMVPRGQQ